jgi:hypothetical protein
MKRCTSRAHGTTCSISAKKLVPPRLLPLAGVFRLRKTLLPLHRPAPRVPPDPPLLPDASAQNPRIFQCFPNGTLRRIPHSAVSTSWVSRPEPTATRHPIEPILGTPEKGRLGGKGRRCYRRI